MSDELKTTLPPFTTKEVVATLSQLTGWGVQQLNVPNTWKISKGLGITVMVVDTGYTDHIDLEDTIITSKSRSCISYEPEITDFQGHSTACCGVIGANNNATGMVGVAPDCKIITVKALDRNGSGSMQALELALKYATEVKPDVVSMSLGAPVGTPLIHKYIKDLYNMNIPVICAAGNSGRRNDVNYPAAYPETIAVTAYDRHGNPARFNSTGPQVDFSAPGVDIYTTWLDNKYTNISGTSFACPFVAGLVALLLSKHRFQEISIGKNDCQTVEQIKEHLIKYSDDKGIIGRDPVWGYGVINPNKLISAQGEDSSSEQEDPKVEVEEPIVTPPKQTILEWILEQIRKLFS